jgi:hypothetical protein
MEVVLGNRCPAIRSNTFLIAISVGETPPDRFCQKVFPLLSGLINNGSDSWRPAVPHSIKGFIV